MSLNLLKIYKPLKHQGGKIDKPPDKKGPFRTMPDSGKDPHHQHIPKYNIHIFHPGASQWEINIFLKPGAQGNMPSPPEFSDGFWDIGIIKVLLEFKAEH